MEQTTELVKLYYKGKLGTFPLAMNRVRAGLMLMKDYRLSLYSAKMTSSYDGLTRIGRGSGYDTAAGCTYDASDRYMGAINFVGQYQLYALHFLRDDLNVREFILRNPILNKGNKSTYKAVYMALCETLDRLIVYYDQLQMEKAV